MVRQHIMAGVCGRAKLLWMTKKQKRGGERGPHYLLPGNASSDIKTSWQAPPIRGSTTSGFHHPKDQAFTTWAFEGHSTPEL
jgi:hypothetical protein